jgi:hypothetical protein
MDHSESSPTQPSCLAEKHPVLVRQLEGGLTPLSAQSSNAGQVSATGCGIPSLLPTPTDNVTVTEPQSPNNDQQEENDDQEKDDDQRKMRNRK